VYFLEYILSEYSGYADKSKKMRKDLEYAIKKFGVDSI